MAWRSARPPRKDADGKLELTIARQRGGRSVPNAQTSQRIPETVFAMGKDEVVTAREGTTYRIWALKGGANP